MKDAGRLPTAQGFLDQSAGAFQVSEGVERAGGKVLARVPIAAATVETWIERIREAREYVNLIVDFVRPRVVRLESELLVVSAKLRLQCVVV